MAELVIARQLAVGDVMPRRLMVVSVVRDAATGEVVFVTSDGQRGVVGPTARLVVMRRRHLGAA